MDQEKPDSFLLGGGVGGRQQQDRLQPAQAVSAGQRDQRLMNYPFRTAALDWLRGGDAAVFRDTMEVIREHYPGPPLQRPEHSGHHDTPRILTLLGAEDVPDTKDGRAAYRLSLPAAEGPGPAAGGRDAAVLLPRLPTVYYGDEAGMEALRTPEPGDYPWGREDQELLAFFRQLGQLRRERCPCRRGT